MDMCNFKDLIDRIKCNEAKKRAAVVSAQDEHTLEAVLKAAKENIITPILIGDKAGIKVILEKLDMKLDDESILQTKSDGEAAKLAVSLIQKNKADLVMKGKIQSAELLRALVNKDNGLRTGKIMSHIAIFELPFYHKLLAVTDGGMVMYPSMEEKKQIIDNAVNVFNALGYEKPKVAVLAAVENVNEKMPETIDANTLQKMYEQGELKNCILAGPISFDLAVSREAAGIKGYTSPVAGDADILIAPNITAGNILAKALSCSAGAKMAGFIVGAGAPVVLTSRGASTEEKYLSLVLAASSIFKI